jgi:4-carboxymuconolactone decarboxylase
MPESKYRPEFDTARFRHGVVTRRAVLGDAHVDRALGATDELRVDIQQLVTEFAWGDIWTRPGLDRRSRSMITVAMLCALNRPHELKGHLRGALNNGVTREEIKEILLQVAVYCGFPASIDAHRIAAELFAELDAP